VEAVFSLEIKALMSLPCMLSSSPPPFPQRFRYRTAARKPLG
jgi:hypothetical protein